MESVQRRYDLDWLRVLAVIMVLFFHTSMLFVAEEWWHIKNPETSNIFLEFNFFLSRFRMPLLFFISGTVSFFMLQKRSGGNFIVQRLKRLMVPVIVGIFFIVPPQIYLERLNAGVPYKSYLDFYPSVFNFVAYPKGNTSWHHLWFIVYLFVYDLIATPVFVWLSSAKGKAFSHRYFGFLSKGQLIYLLVIPTLIINNTLSLRFPDTHDLIHDYASLPYYFCFLFFGFFLTTQTATWDSLVRNRRLSLAIALICIVWINYYRWNSLEPWKLHENWRDLPQTYFYFSLRSINTWFWIFALLGYGKRYLNKPSPLLNYANEGILPFYVLHQTIIIIIGFYVIRTTDTILLKYLFTSMVSLMITILIYHLFIRPFNLMRFLFGMKPKGRQEIPVPTASHVQKETALLLS